VLTLCPLGLILPPCPRRDAGVPQRDVPLRRPPHRTPLSLALSHDGGRSWGKTKVIESDPEGGYCYTAVEWVGDRLLLGYCAHRSRWGLQTSQILSIDRAQIEH
jgi:hypothetical protein